MQFCSLFEISDQLNFQQGTKNCLNIISGCVCKISRNFLFLKLHAMMPQHSFWNSKITCPNLTLVFSWTISFMACPTANESTFCLI
jgi:hypothetical protein